MSERTVTTATGKMAATQHGSHGQWVSFLLFWGLGVAKAASDPASLSWVTRKDKQLLLKMRLLWIQPLDSKPLIFGILLSICTKN